jgi:alcohol dehydrogenase/propanol-preferring alcohol dehydrogenase
MRAWAVVANGAPLQEIELPTPEPTGTQVLLEVTHCGVCHSDLHVWEGEWDLGGGQKLRLADRGVTLPLAMGHEIVGRVLKAGPDAGDVPVGATRIVYPWVGCGTCPVCLGENDNLCPVTTRSIGIFQNGGYATHVLAMHPRHLVDPGDLDPAVAATYACSGITVFSAIRKLLPMPPEEPVVLVGAGGLGLAAIGMLRALGHRAIATVDVSADKREAAGKAGATILIDGSGEPEQVTGRIAAQCGGLVRSVIDMVNGAATARAAFAALVKGGRLVQVGLFGGELRVPLPLMAMRQLSLMGSYVGSPADLRELVAIAQSGRLPALPVTEVPQSSADAALMQLRDGKVTGRLVLRAEAVSGPG